MLGGEHPFDGESILNKNKNKVLYIFFLSPPCCIFFSYQFFLSISLSGASDGTTGIYEKSLSVFFLCKSLFDNFYTVMHSSYILSFVSP